MANISEIIKALDLDPESARYVLNNPNCIGYWDDESSNKTAGHTGWVAHFDESGTAVAVTNGDPVHIENVDSLEQAIRVASGAGDDTFALSVVHSGTGEQRGLYGETLDELHHELAEFDDAATEHRVTNDQGFTVGWVSATDWRAE